MKNITRSVKRRILICILIVPIVLLFLACYISSDLITETISYKGGLQGMALIPKVLYCKWEGSSSKAEDICMGFLWKSEEEKVSARLEEHIRYAINGSAFIDMYPITYIRGVFEWDTMYVFPPYTSIEQINKTIGFPWLTKNSNITHISSFNDRNLLVFTQGKKIIGYLDLLKNVEI